MSATKIETGHTDMIHDVAIDYYGKHLATASSDMSVKVLSMGTPSSPAQLLATLSGHHGSVWRVAWAHPSFGTVLASCSVDGQVIIWKEGSRANQWGAAHIFTDHKASVNCIAWAPSELGLCLACGSSDGTVSVHVPRTDGGWDASKIERAHPVGVTSLSWAPATSPGSFIGSGSFVQKIVSGGFDGCVKVWELINGEWKLESSLSAGQMHKDCVRDVAWAPALGMPKPTIASGSHDGLVLIWTKPADGAAWQCKVMNDFKVPVWRISWSLTGDVLSVADGDGNITLWKTATNGQWQQVTKVEN